MDKISFHVKLIFMLSIDNNIIDMLFVIVLKNQFSASHLTSTNNEMFKRVCLTSLISKMKKSYSHENQFLLYHDHLDYTIFLYMYKYIFKLDTT